MEDRADCRMTANTKRFRSIKGETNRLIVEFVTLSTALAIAFAVKARSKLTKHFYLFWPCPDRAARRATEN
jgi:hypothetical protein